MGCIAWRITRFDSTRPRAVVSKENPMTFIRDFRWALRYWRSYHREEDLYGPFRHAWKYARHVAPANRADDRVKYG